MVLQNIKDLRKSDRGFTIIELLIVIVIIAILAAITIVAYSGLTTKADNSAAESNASSVKSVAEAFNADRGHYPQSVSDMTGYGGQAGDSTKLPTGVTLSDGSTALTSSNGTNNIYFTSDSSNDGDCIGWYGYSENGGIQWMYTGNASGTPSISSGAITGCAG